MAARTGAKRLDEPAYFGFGAAFEAAFRSASAVVPRRGTIGCSGGGRTILQARTRSVAIMTTTPSHNSFGSERRLFAISCRATCATAWERWVPHRQVSTEAGTRRSQDGHFQTR